MTDNWGFPELTDEENATISEARRLGFASFWPALPDAKSQAMNTLEGAKRFLKEREKQIERLSK